MLHTKQGAEEPEPLPPASDANIKGHMYTAGPGHYAREEGACLVLVATGMCAEQISVHVLHAYRKDPVISFYNFLSIYPTMFLCFPWST